MNDSLIPTGSNRNNSSSKATGKSYAMFTHTETGNDKATREHLFPLRADDFQRHKEQWALTTRHGHVQTMLRKILSYANMERLGTVTTNRSEDN